MRIKNTLRNSLVAIVSFAILSLIAILTRKIFISNLPSEYLGYEGLFNNILALLSVTDFGLDVLIVYRLYPAFSARNYDEVFDIVNIYRFLYKSVGIFIFLVGIFLIPLLPFIIKDNSFPWNYVICIYLLQLINSLCTYFFSYKRIVYVASQQEYRCQCVDTICFLFTSVFRIATLIILQDYFIFLLLGIINSFISNLIISKNVDKEFPFLKKSKSVSLKHLSQKNILTDLKHNIVHRVSATVYGATDNIIVSSFIGIHSVALLSNYSLILGYITSALLKILHPFQAAIGDLINSNKNVSHDMFLMFNRVSFIIATVVSSLFFSLFNPFISLWLGNDYLLPQSFVLFCALNQYIAWNHTFLLYYRLSFGYFEIDKMYIAFGAVLNVLFSIILVAPMGISGVILGTIIGHLGFWFGRVKAVYKILFPGCIWVYLKGQLINIFALCLSFYFCSLFNCALFSKSFFYFFCYLILCLIISFFVSCFFSLPFGESKLILKYVKKTYESLKISICSK